MNFEAGDFYIMGGEIWRVLCTLDEPGVVFEEVKTGHKTPMVGQSSLIARAYVKLVPEETDNREESLNS